MSSQKTQKTNNMSVTYCTRALGVRVCICKHAPPGVSKRADKKAVAKAAAKAKPSGAAAEPAADAEDAVPGEMASVDEPMAPIAPEDVQRIVKRRMRDGVERECLIKLTDEDVNKRILFMFSLGSWAT